MNANDLLVRLGWPEGRGDGMARWVGVSADGCSPLVCVALKRRGSLVASVELGEGEAAEPLARVEAKLFADRARILKSEAGSPPQPMPAEDAIDVIEALRSRLPSFAFEPATEPRPGPGA